MVGGVGMAAVGGGDVVDHGRDLPAKGVEIEPLVPEAGPTGSRVTDPFSPPGWFAVAAVSGDDLGDRGTTGPAERFEMRPAPEQWLGQGMAAGGMPQIGKRPRRERPQAALDAVGIDGGEVAAPHRPPQPDLTGWWDRHWRDAEHLVAAGQHVSIDHVSLRRPGDGLAQPGRVAVGDEADLTPGVGYDMGQRQPGPGGGLGHHHRPGIGLEAFGERRQPSQRGPGGEVLAHLAAYRDLVWCP